MSFDICISNTSLCEQLPSYVSLARLSSRDISKPAPADQAFLPGIDLNSALFANNYTQSKLNQVFDLLDSGFQALFIDIYWSAQHQRWQLCPFEYTDSTPTPSSSSISTSKSAETISISEVPFNTDTNTEAKTTTSTNRTATVGATYSTGVAKIESHYTNGTSYSCDASVGLDQFLATISSFITQTDTNLAVNLLSITFRPRLLQNNSTGITNNLLSTSLSSGLDYRMFTPAHLVYTRSLTSVVTTKTSRGIANWPTLDAVLLGYKLRVVTIIDTSFVSRSTLGLDPSLLMFFAQNDTTATIAGSVPFQQRDYTGNIISESQLANLSSRSFRFTSIGATEDGGSGSIVDDWHTATKEGWSPVLNQTVDSATMMTLLSSSWGWKNGEPAAQTYASRKEMLLSQDLEMCVVQTSEGWAVENCNNNLPTLCGNPEYFYSWEVDSGNNFFDANCDKRYYSFQSPTTPLQARLLRTQVSNGSYPISWIAMNSLSAPNCWVGGNSLAFCPYATAEETRDGTALLGVASGLSFLFMCLTIWLEIYSNRMPLQRRNLAKRFEGRPRPPAHALESDGIAG